MIIAGGAPACGAALAVRARTRRASRRAVVAGAVERRPLGPAAAAAPRADLRLGMRAARPAQADQVEAPRRAQHRRRMPAARARGPSAHAQVVEIELEKRC